MFVGVASGGPAGGSAIGLGLGPSVHKPQILYPNNTNHELQRFASDDVFNTDYMLRSSYTS
jgi:hypothetical protein